ncbi:GNAT family N-acetyltransferase [Empedobacter stercoris]|uniref:GNAT family N-acetyltransferase n=1 Tax=Empedobacter falsenii TaxID=343874 RepID=A0ABY8VD33_9FLAO|nr:MULTISPECIES: GNAT family N-acetyltransferase [Empedobacter]MDM1522567.1 GNAT family N-acetyltransferase [Empedobacter sp. 225-1]MDM1542757.1 GNAT family N-acetyltransferase [Empedobacter sp. 189-2]UWX65834.1 GNAT family N-acetyltransferase [Empedobacter stercoris]WIH98670.1 GNAT family N-acetyltransferase [Empedobacter falsenii]
MTKQATINDLQTLAPLFDAYRQFYDKESDVEGAKEFLLERIANNESVIYLAFDEKENAVGFVQLYPLFSSTRMKRFWMLNDLFVSPEFRGQGFSRELIDQAKKLCRKTDACAMLLETSVTNEIGNSLYPSAGFILRDDANFYEWEVEPN